MNPYASSSNSRPPRVGGIPSSNHYHHHLPSNHSNTSGTGGKGKGKAREEAEEEEEEIEMEEEPRVFMVQFREPQQKKNKSWTDDGALIIDPFPPYKTILRNIISHKNVVEGPLPPKYLQPGALDSDEEIKFAGREIRIDDQSTYRDYLLLEGPNLAKPVPPPLPLPIPRSLSKPISLPRPKPALLQKPPQAQPPPRLPPPPQPQFNQVQKPAVKGQFKAHKLRKAEDVEGGEKKRVLGVFRDEVRRRESVEKEEEDEEEEKDGKRKGEVLERERKKVRREKSQSQSQEEVKEREKEVRKKKKEVQVEEELKDSEVENEDQEDEEEVGDIIQESDGSDSENEDEEMRVDSPHPPPLGAEEEEEDELDEESDEWKKVLTAQDDSDDEDQPHLSKSPNNLQHQQQEPNLSPELNPPSPTSSDTVAVEDPPSPTSSDTVDVGSDHEIEVEEGENRNIEEEEEAQSSPSPTPSGAKTLPPRLPSQTQLPPSSPTQDSQLDVLFRAPGQPPPARRPPPPLPTEDEDEEMMEVFTQREKVVVVIEEEEKEEMVTEKNKKKPKPWDNLSTGYSSEIEVQEVKRGRERESSDEVVIVGSRDKGKGKMKERLEVGEKRKWYFQVQFRKANHKKIWEDDGVLMITTNAQGGHQGLVRDKEEGKEVAKGHVKFAKDKTDFSLGDHLMIGGKEIWLEYDLPESEYLDESIFTKGRPTSALPPPPNSNILNKPLQPKPSNVSGKFVHHNPLAGPKKTDLAKEKFAIPALLPKPAISASVNFYAAPVKKIGPKFDPIAEGAVVMRRPQGYLNKKNATIVDVVVDPVIGEKLMPHQVEGVKFMYECVMGIRHQEGHGCILADDMGLGKSIQAIALVHTLLKQNPFGGVGGVVDRALIVCPATLVRNWQTEIRKWLGRDRMTVFVADAKKDVKTFANSKSYQVLIIGYEKLRTVIEEVKFCQPPIGLIICDEGHKLKGTETLIAKALRTLSTPRRIILSGTPVQNNLSELHAMVDFINPGTLSDYSLFKRTYETPIVKSRDPKASAKDRERGEDLSAKLSEELLQYLLRREGDVIKKYLPPKFEYTVFITPTDLEIKLYQAILDGKAVREVLNGAGSQQLSLLTALRKLSTTPGLLMQQSEQETGKDILTTAVTSLFPRNTSPNNFDLSGKLKVLGSFLLSLHESNALEKDEKLKEKVVVLSNFTQTLDIVEKYCKMMKYPHCRLDGKTPQGDRIPMVDGFNRGHIKTNFVFLLSSKSGGTGLNIIGASRLIALDGDWNPSNDAQAMARIHRQGQTKPCYIYRFLTTGTMDEKIFQRQVTKLSLSNTFINRKDGKSKGESAAGGSEGGNAFTLEDLRNIFRLHTDTASQTHDLLECSCYIKTVKIKPDPDAAPTLTLEDDETEEEEEFLPTNAFVRASQWKPEKPTKIAAPPATKLLTLRQQTHFNPRDDDSLDKLEDVILKQVIYRRIADGSTTEDGVTAPGGDTTLYGGNVSFVFLSLGDEDGGK